MTAQIKLTTAAQRNVDETSTDVAADIAALRAGKTPGALLADCLDGADDDRIEGWREYVAAVAAAAGVEAGEDEPSDDALLDAIAARRVDDAMRALIAGETTLEVDYDTLESWGDDTVAWIESKGLTVDTTDTEIVTISAE